MENKERTGFNHKYNTDDVLMRAVIIGLINEMNEKIFITNIISDSETKRINIPFYYAFSGDERFWQDYIQNWSDCIPNFIEGNYDRIPRGSLQLSGMNIVSANMTSRYVRGYFVREEEGTLKRYSSYINSIPMSFQFDVKILVDSTIDSFKITQELIKIFYKTMVFRVNYGGTVIPSQAGFPESYTNDKQFEYSFEDQTRTTVSFTLEVETYFPIFDDKQTMFAGDRIEKTTVSIGASGPRANINLINTNEPLAGINKTSDLDKNEQTFIDSEPDNTKYTGNYWE